MNNLHSSTVAILGASPKPDRFSNRAVLALKDRVRGVFPIHPTADHIHGLPCWKDFPSLPIRPDILSIYLAEANLLPIMDELEEKGAGEFWLNPGADSPAIVREFMRRSLPFRQTCTLIEAEKNLVDPTA